MKLQRAYWHAFCMEVHFEMHSGPGLSFECCHAAAHGAARSLFGHYVLIKKIKKRSQNADQKT